MNSALRIHAIGGPTLLVELGGLRLLTDPTFDGPGEYVVGSRTLTKTASPGIDLAEIGRVDVVLLSHDQHPDNLDHRGRDLLAQVPVVLSTPIAASRLAGVVGVTAWEDHLIPRPDGSDLHITCVPAQHGPDGTEDVTGPVVGFVLWALDVPTIYVSGDNASLRIVDEIAERFPSIDVAVLFAGAARTPLLGDANLTLTSAQAALRLEATWVVPAHFNSWAHFTEGAEQIGAAFEAAGLTSRLVLLAPGSQADLPLNLRRAGRAGD